MLRLFETWRQAALRRFWPGKAARREIDRFLHHVHVLAGQVSSGPPQPYPWDARAVPVPALPGPTSAISEADPDRPCLISFIVPVYNTRPDYLADLIRSLAIQRPAPFEVILSDDGSTDMATLAALEALRGTSWIRIVQHPNGNISRATNRGLAVATGTWIGLIDHDDALFPYAVERVIRAIEAAPDAALFYTDEIITDGALKADGLFLKPAWDPVLFSGVNYTNHLTLYRRDRLTALGGWREGYEGSQDFDLMLRYTADLPASAIRHVPYPAYLWRRDGGSYSARYLDMATSRARQALLDRYGPDHPGLEIGPALVPDLHRLRFDKATLRWPRISVVIPNRNSPDLLRQVLTGLFEGTDYPDFEVVIVDNGTTHAETLAIYAQHQDNPRFRLDMETRPFNFSYAVNRGMALATGEHVLLLNNDIEILEPGWLKEMVSCLAFPETGIVGAKLLYPDRTTQHLGVIAGYGTLAGHWYLGQKADFHGPMNRFALRQSLEIVTGACFLISRACLEAVGPFDEEAFKVAYNDVDYCLRARKAGFRVVFTPFATLIHHESASRGSDETPENRARFDREKAALEARHQTSTYRDGALNPWYGRSHSVPQIVLRPDLPDLQ